MLIGQLIFNPYLSLTGPGLSHSTLYVVPCLRHIKNAIAFHFETCCMYQKLKAKVASVTAIIFFHMITFTPQFSYMIFIYSQTPLFQRKIEFPWIYPYVFSHLLSAISNSVISNSPLFRTCRSFPTP